jgi:UDP-N-acetylglucosamine--N-acetylmuramyl-(pentapeptide) pyrophosphoryl-undecaprenol N-acetylglucosamine transferase
VRTEIRRWERAEARKHFELADDAPTLLVFGGSKGARTINSAVAAVLPELLKDMQIIHLSGEANWAEAQASQAALKPQLAARYHAFPYLHDDMGAAFAAADLALCRAGASTLGELPLFSLPAVLVPIPLKGHLQAENAAYLQNRGAAVILPDEQMTTQLVKTVRGLFNDKARLNAMRVAMAKLAAPNAAKQIAAQLHALGMRGQEARA